MQPFHLVYLVHDAGARASFFEEHARRAAELGHQVTVVSDPDADLPPAEFIFATGPESASRATEARTGLPLHWVLDSPRAAADPDALDHALRRSTFKLTIDARIQQQLQRRYRSRCWCLPDPVTPRSEDRIPAIPRAHEAKTWRLLVTGTADDDELAATYDAIRSLRERDFDLVVARLSADPPRAVEADSGQIDRWLGDAAKSARRAVYRNVDVVLVVGEDVDDVGTEAMAHGPCLVRLDGDARSAVQANELVAADPTASYLASLPGGALHLPRADVAAAVDALEHVFTDAELRRGLSEAARRVSGMWGWTEHFDRLHAILDEIVVTYGSTYGHDRNAPLSSPIRSLQTAILDRQIEFAESLVVGRHVTVIGCGQTDIAVRLAEHGAEAVTAYDPSDVALAYAGRHRAHPNVWYEKLSGDLGFDPTDVVVALEPLARGVPSADVVRAAADRLSPGGALLLSAPLGDDSDGEDDPSLNFAKDTWLDEHLRLLKDSFQKVIPLGQRDVAGDLLIGPELLAPESVSYLLLAIHPTRAEPPDETAIDDRARSAAPIDIAKLRNESRRRGRAA